MLYVGLTEDHKKSAAMFADVVGAQAISQLRVSSAGVETASTNESGSCRATSTASSLQVLFFGAFEQVLLNTV